MNIATNYVTALEALGYTQEEACFLYLVATHSGYFVAGQFLAFAGVHWDKRTTLFWNKLRSKKHARTYQLAKHGTVYHVFARKVYRQIGRENLPNRRDHEIEYIRTRVAMLDFVLGNPGFCYLETEGDKLAYFNDELKVGVEHLPSKTYQRGRTVQPTVRYFADRFPMFFQDRNAAPRVVTFTFIQGSEANLSAFVHHLHAYLPLFRELEEFRFLYLARWDAHFRKARELFHSFVTISLESNPAEDLLRYFSIRKAWDCREYASLTEGDLIFRNLAKQRFPGERFEHLYRAWKAGRLAESQIRFQLTGSEMPHLAHFDAQILKPFAPPAQAEFQKLKSGRRPIMSIIRKAPAILTREFRIEEPVSILLDDYAQFIESSADHVINSALKKTLWRDQDYRKWREQRRNSGGEAAEHGLIEGLAKP